MNKRIGTMYVAVVDNRVQFLESNLTKFYELLKSAEPDVKGYNAFYKDFQKNDLLKYVNKEDKVYILQKVL